MDTKDKLIEKLKEFIKHQQRFMISSGDIRADLWESKRKRLESEIAALEKQIEEKKPIEDRSAEITFNDDMDDEEQESKPVYDEAYLNECIEKAMPNLSKIKDVDKELAEIRGEQELKSQKELIKLYDELVAIRDYMEKKGAIYGSGQIDDLIKRFDNYLKTK